MDVKYNIRGISMKAKNKIKTLQKVTQIIAMASALLFCFALGVAVGQKMKSYEPEFEYKSPEQCLNVCVDLFERMGC